MNETDAIITSLRMYNDGYNQALEDLSEGIKEILEDNAIYNFDCIDTLVTQLKK